MSALLHVSTMLLMGSTPPLQDKPVFELGGSTSIGRFESGAQSYVPVFGGRMYGRLEKTLWYAEAQIGMRSSLENGVDALGVTSRWFTMSALGGMYHDFNALTFSWIVIGVEAAAGPSIRVDQSSLRVYTQRRHVAQARLLFETEAGLRFRLGENFMLRLTSTLALPTRDLMSLWLSCGWRW